MRDTGAHLAEAEVLMRQALQIPAVLQPIDGFPHHPIAEMSLAHAQQFRAAPFLLDRFDLARWRD